jgi:hypothetical protein
MPVHTESTIIPAVAAAVISYRRRHVINYTTAELLYNEEAEENIILINFESSKASNEAGGNEDSHCILKCKICGDSFIFKSEETIFSKWLDHIKSHYIDKALIKKERIAKDIIHLNYDSVLQIASSDQDKNNDVSSSITYRQLTEREGSAYRNALHRIRNEESITKTKAR